jgi:hypothetical protein
MNHWDGNGDLSAAACLGCPYHLDSCPSPPPESPPPPASPPSPPSTPPVCGPDSELTTVVPKMHEHASFGGTHGAVGDEDLMSGTFNGCIAACTGACASANKDIPDDVPIYYCDTNDETGAALEYPRCAHECTTAGLATSCVGVCAAGTYCCASTGGSCIPVGETCPCPDCATTWGSTKCDVNGPLYFEIETGSSATKCCAPSPPSQPPPPPPDPFLPTPVIDPTDATVDPPLLTHEPSPPPPEPPPTPPHEPVAEPTLPTKPSPTPAPVVMGYIIGGLVAACGFFALALGFCCATPVAAAASDCGPPPDKRKDPLAYARWQRECERKRKETPGESIQLLRVVA